MYKLSVDNKLVLGSRQAWIAMRAMEAVVFLSLLVLMPPLITHPSLFHTDGRDFLPFLGIFGALIFAGFAQAHRIVYGFVDAGGIHYHRYLHWKYVSWEQIESIAKRPWARFMSMWRGRISLADILCSSTTRWYLGRNPNLLLSTVLEVCGFERDNPRRAYEKQGFEP